MLLSPLRLVESRGFLITARSCGRNLTMMKKKSLSLVVMVLLLGLAPVTGRGSQAEVRATVQSVFDQLKSHNYSALYDLLPASARSRMSRERFVGALLRAQGFYHLDRMD